LLGIHGEMHKERIMKGTRQLAGNWIAEEEGKESFKNFCLENFLSGEELQKNFLRISRNMEMLDGHTKWIRHYYFESEAFTDTEELGVDPYYRKSLPHADPYESKLAAFIQLNFPYYSLEEKRERGADCTREEWAKVRLGDLYYSVVPPGFEGENPEAARDWKEYMRHYFLRMDHVSMPDGSYPFPHGSYLHSHRGLRDNVKEEYTWQGGLARQKLTGIVVEHILQGTIPLEFLTDTQTRWDPWENKLFRMQSGEWVAVDFQFEDTKRYEGFKSVFVNRASWDKFYDKESTVISRTFAKHNLMVDEVEQLITDFLSDPVLMEAGKLIEQRLGRSLEPFDIWYSGFQEQSFYKADFLDSLTREKYPTVMDFQNDLPNILKRIGFPEKEANFLGNQITVRPVPSGGYTNSPPLPGDNALMTTMFLPEGLDYKSFRVAMHELGHAVEKLYTMEESEFPILRGVPANGITEGSAELLAYRNMQALGFNPLSQEEQKHLQALATLWYLLEMGGQALTDIRTWQWMYEHPDATPDELKDAVLGLTAEIWNTYFSPIFNVRDQHILSIYNHYITGSLYLYNYFYGNVVMYQMFDAFKEEGLASGLRRACSEGRTLPDLWLENATGKPVTIEPILNASREAITYYKSLQVN